MSQIIKGTFASGQSTNLGLVSDAIIVPTLPITGLSGTPQNPTNRLKVTLRNNDAAAPWSVIDASNTAKTQKSVDNGQSWVDQTTYAAAQAAVAVIVAVGEMWRLALVSQQQGKSMDYELSMLS